MKKVYFIFIILIIICFIFINDSKYVELNELIIIDRIEIECKDKYYLKFREVIPRRDNNDISYKYKYYSGEGYLYKDIVLDVFKSKTYYIPHDISIKSKCSLNDLDILFNKKE